MPRSSLGKRTLGSFISGLGSKIKHVANKVVGAAHKGYNAYRKIDHFLDTKGLKGPALEFFNKNAPAEIKDTVSDLKRMAEKLPDGVKDVVKRGKIDADDAYNITREVIERHNQRAPRKKLTAEDLASADDA
jgi:hypothetical protein